jgi:hypothetical protein
LGRKETEKKPALFHSPWTARKTQCCHPLLFCPVSERREDAAWRIKDEVM